MKVGTIVAKTKSGEWVTLAQPDVSLNDQKVFFKQLREVNGRNVRINGKNVDLAEVHLFVSGSGKHVRFKEPGASMVGNPPDGEFAANLKELAEKLSITKEALDDLRGMEGFPEKEKSGYNVAAVRCFLEGHRP